ncbi:MAG TPA: alanyl-tRNA editing protein [Paracoccus sp.]|nr:alanyl-tRNA editing protein [Paracoccus sp. (in: a-proteobacteria)]
MTEPLFRTDPYLRQCAARITGTTENGALIIDRSVFYPAGGGQPGDSGVLRWTEGTLEIIDTIKAGDGVALVPAPGAALPGPGERVELALDWDRRHRHMRVHTALHLLSVVLPLPVTGGAIGAEKGRLDFDMPEAPADKDALEAALNALIARDLPLREDWITEAELDANPALVKTMSVQPPRGQGRIRLVRIGEGEVPVDLQPCGGTHVARTGEIGPVRLGKIEKKGRQNRRVTLHLA